METVRLGTSRKSAIQAFLPMLKEPSGLTTSMSLRVPGERPGVVAVSSIGLTTETPVAATPPIVTVKPSAKPKAVIVTAVPPAAGPDEGMHPVAGGVKCPSLSPDCSVNHRSPSEPVVMPQGSALGVGMGYSVIVPAIVIRPTLLPTNSVNHRLPSGPAVMPKGMAPASEWETP